MVLDGLLYIKNKQDVGRSLTLNIKVNTNHMKIGTANQIRNLRERKDLDFRHRHIDLGFDHLGQCSSSIAGTNIAYFL